MRGVLRGRVATVRESGRRGHPAISRWIFLFTNSRRLLSGCIDTSRLSCFPFYWCAGILLDDLRSWGSKAEEGPAS